MQTFDRFEIRFNLVSFPTDEELELIVAEIYINDRALIDIVREIEEPFVHLEIEKRHAAGGDIRDYSGEYSYLLARWVLLPSRRLLDEPDDLRGAMVLGCTCGWPDCWCIRAQIAITDSTVEWSNFSHDFRDWEYNLGFRFERNQYLAQLSKAVTLPGLAGEYRAATADYDRAIELNPDDADNYINRGRVNSDLGDYQAAIADYDRAIELNPNFVAYCNRGAVKSDLGDYQGAIADYDEAIELEPSGCGFVYSKRGNAKSSLGDYQGAIADCDRAIELAPDDADNYFNRGNVKSRVGDYQAAITDYDRAIELNPKHAFTYHCRGEEKSKLGNKQQAIVDLITAFILFYQQNNTDFHTRIVNLIADTCIENKQKGIVDLITTSELFYQQKSTNVYVRAINSIADTCTENKQKDIVNSTTTISSLFYQENKLNLCDRTINLIADIYISQGDKEFSSEDDWRAIANYDKAIELSPNHADLYLNRGNAKYNLGEYQSAIYYYDRAIELEPNDAVYNNRGKAKDR
jgi:tetratricopeptide (TPR) repeat protein